MSVICDLLRTTSTHQYTASPYTTRLAVPHYSMYFIRDLHSTPKSGMRPKLLISIPPCVRDEILIKSLLTIFSL